MPVLPRIVALTGFLAVCLGAPGADAKPKPKRPSPTTSQAGIAEAKQQEEPEEQEQQGRHLEPDPPAHQARSG